MSRNPELAPSGQNSPPRDQRVDPSDPVVGHLGATALGPEQNPAVGYLGGTAVHGTVDSGAFAAPEPQTATQQQVSPEAEPQRDRT